MKQLGPLIWPCLEKGKEQRREDVKEKKSEKQVQRRYKEPQWVESRKAIHAKVIGIPLGQGPRKNFEIEKENSF